MTAGRAEERAAAQAVAAGEAFAAGLAATSQREARATSGSDMATSQAGLEGPAAVTWPSPSPAGQPPAVSPQPTSSPNVDRPYDNSQSQP